MALTDAVAETPAKVCILTLDTLKEPFLFNRLNQNAKMKDDQKKTAAPPPRKQRKINKLQNDYQREKDLKNEAYFFIIESGNFDNFKNWVYDRRADGLTAATAHKECLMFLGGVKETVKLTVTDPDRWAKVQAMAKAMKEGKHPTNNEVLKAFFEERAKEATRHTPSPHTAQDELIATLKDCNETQRQLINLQAEKIASLKAQLNSFNSKSKKGL